MAANRMESTDGIGRSKLGPVENCMVVRGCK